MNIIELKAKLNELGVEPNEYSLEGSVANWNTIVLYKNYSIWEVFYVDERGNRDDKHTFHSENEACEYIYEEFKRLVNS